MSHDTLAPELPEGDRSGQRWTWAVGGVLLLAAVLRLYQLDRTSLWYDEAVSWFQSKDTLADLFTRVASDNYPPLHNLMLWAVMRLGVDSETALRLPSGLCGILAVWLLYLLGKTVFSRASGLLAASLLALSPFHIWYSTEARMYSVFAATGLLYLLGLALLLKPEGTRHPTGATVLAATGGALFLYSHVYAPFSIAGAAGLLCVLLLLRLMARADKGFEPRPLRPLLLSLLATALAGAAFLPWLAVLISRAQHVVGGGFWIAYPDLGFLTVMVRDMAGSETVFLILAALTAASLLPGGNRVIGTDTRLVLAAYAIAPWLLAYLVSVTLRPILFDRYLITTWPVLLLLASAGAERLLRKPGLILLLAGVPALTIAPLKHTLTEKLRPEWRPIAQTYLQERVGEAPILLHKPFAAPALEYYVKDRAVPVLIETADEIPENFTAPEVWLLICHSGKSEMQSMIDAVPAGYREAGHWHHFGWGASGLTLIRYAAVNAEENLR
ncbi:glycosyltransferase family 39 protein [Roseibium litorale]|uniref:Glycosyltransferase family 39 protein n=1 Tax=Roseibium litorale TaxID=2803841 RepID=A0ABR9CIF8_9HYPH|nr:glycosyltransferase family 39 protein [Roseibium litorale]MBD8890596.1 glycosyltransferase family 39 protein [Roseibium litorale]